MTVMGQMRLAEQAIGERCSPECASDLAVRETTIYVYNGLLEKQCRTLRFQKQM